MQCLQAVSARKVAAMMAMCFLLFALYLSCVPRKVKNLDSDAMSSFSGHYPSCDSMLEHVITNDIQLVAVDFDETIIDIHTGGLWRHSPDLLVRHVRPQMQCFLHHCLERGIPVAVTTFSSQTSLIQSVIQTSLAQFARQSADDSHVHDDSEESAAAIPVFGGDIFLEGLDHGKQSQLAAAMQHVNERRRRRCQEADENVACGISDDISPSVTLLIDDDEDNIRVAAEDGYHTILYQPILTVPMRKEQHDEL